MTATRMVIATAALGMVILFAAGCTQCPQTRVSMEKLIADHNANAAPVTRLWARVKMDVTVMDPKGRTFALNSATPNGLLVLRKPPGRLGLCDFALVGRQSGQELFRVGSSIDEGVYYFWYRFGGSARAWWGRREFAGAPGVTALPIDPHQLLAVLGIGELPSDFTKLPTVAMTMSKSPCAYVLTYIDRQSVTGRILFQRRMYFRWADDKPPKPFLVEFLSPDGEPVMAAKLKNYKPIALAGDSVMPTDITLEITQSRPDERANPIRRIHMVLSQMTTADKWDNSAVRFDENIPPGIEKTQIDAHIKPSGGKK